MALPFFPAPEVGEVLLLATLGILPRRAALGLLTPDLAILLLVLGLLLEALAPLFAPYAKHLARTVQDPQAVAQFVLVSATALKHAARSEEELRAGLRTLHAAVLALVGEG